MKVRLEKDILNSNNNLAEQNRRLLAQNNIFAINLLSSPGSGKTSILEKTLEKLDGFFQVAVIEGDLATTRDAERIAAKGVSALQINTRGACHLDAKMISDALEHFDLLQIDLLIIENVGNLVCPTDFDLGEDKRVTVLSITEGNDKIVKYPASFVDTDLLLLNKIDLLPFTNFDMKMLEEDLQKVSAGLQFIPVSAVKGEGVDQWIQWLKDNVAAKKQQA